MSKLILAKPNEAKNGLSIPSQYNKMLLQQWLKEYKWIEIRPRAKKSKKRRAFLESAVIPAWGKFNYGLDPRDPKNKEKARFLFKQDFHYEIVKDRSGNPQKISLSMTEEHASVLEKYTEYAEANGAPIPNPELFKKWQNEYSTDYKWDNYYDWLDFLELDVDSMPTRETFKKLKEN